MQSGELTVDVLVPREFVWWTFLALASDPHNPFTDIRFTPRLSADADIAIIDPGLLPQVNDLLRRKQCVAIVLWDGYQSYLRHRPAIDNVRQVARQFKLYVVGSSVELEVNHSMFCKPLFAQVGGLYDNRILSPKSLSRFSFEKPASKFVLLHRSDLLSMKACLQLASAGGIKRYRETRFVFCGQSGAETLKYYEADYGLHPKRARLENTHGGASTEFLSSWLGAIHGYPRQWTNDIIRRALLRVIALDHLVARFGEQVLLNLYPDPNVNAYQAGRLFTKHVFLDFGGINGDEAIYPRAADMLFHRRKSLCFDRSEALRKLEAMNGSDLADCKAFLSWYRQSLDSQLALESGQQSPYSKGGL